MLYHRRWWRHGLGRHRCPVLLRMVIHHDSLGVVDVGTADIDVLRHPPPWWHLVGLLDLRWQWWHLVGKMRWAARHGSLRLYRVDVGHMW